MQTESHQAEVVPDFHFPLAGEKSRHPQSKIRAELNQLAMTAGFYIELARRRHGRMVELMNVLARLDGGIS